MFLVKEDYAPNVRDEVLDILTINQNQALWDDAELKAQSRISSYLNHRYDVAKIFVNVADPWNSGTTYNANDHVVASDRKVYYALQATTNNNPTSSPLHWKLGDLRDKQIIWIMISITLYLLYTGNNARALPEHITADYEAAIKWLEQVSRGIIGPGLPLLSEDAGNPVQAGSNTVQEQYW